MTAEEQWRPVFGEEFQGARPLSFTASAIKSADEEKRGVAVDSSTLLFVDSSFLAELLDAYEWEKAMTAKINSDWNYHQRIAEKIGTRFGICTPLPKKFKREFSGDGFYKIDAKRIKPVKI